jgi:hypothetical protein
MILAIVNKDATRALTPRVAGFRQAMCWSLNAPALTSTQVSLDDRPSVAGHIPTGAERSLIEGGQPARSQGLQIRVPPAAAVFLELMP